MKMTSTTNKAAVFNGAQFTAVTDPSGRQKTDLQQRHTIENKNKQNNSRKLIQGRLEGTIEYRAGMEDTLCSIALKFNSTPNKLVHLNKLYSQSIVPGQRLYIPYPVTAQSEDSPLSSSPSHSPSLSSSDTEYDKLLDADSAEMSSVQWCSSQIVSSSGQIRAEIPTSERFLKICCKYFTDRKGVVMGILYVTPKKIFFDPYKSHPLIIENGCEDYFFSCSTQSIISAESHKDISQMKLSTSSPLREVPIQSKVQQTGRGPANSSQKEKPHILTAAQIKGKSRRAGIKEMDLFSTDQQSKTLTKLSGIPYSCLDSVCQVNMKPCNEVTELRENVTCLDLKENDKAENEGTVPFTNKVKYRGKSSILGSKRCDYSEKVTRERILEQEANPGGNHYLSQILTEGQLCKQNKGEMLCDSLNNTDDNTASFCEINLSDQGCKYLWSVVETAGEKRLYTGMSSLKPEEACSPIDKAKDDPCGLCNKQGINSNETLSTLTRKHGFQQDTCPSKEEEDKLRLMFLCLKVRLPVKKTRLLTFGVATSQDMDRDKSDEYWFAMSQENVSEFHKYLKHWRPDIYLFEEMGDTRADDFVLLDVKCPFSLNEKLFDRLFDDWEVLADLLSYPGFPAHAEYLVTAFEQIITEEDDHLKHLKDIFDPDFENMAPVLQGKSGLMESFHVEKISKYLPPSTVGHPWQLAFSTSLHGFSLKTLYRKVANTDSPVLLVIKDTCGQVFGALTSHPPRPSDHFFGTGETFLYTFNLDFKVFQWTGENSFFIKGSLDSLALGGGSGRFGLWLDEDLNHGRSNPCTTFNNSILSKTEDFTVQDLEVWTFR